MAATIDGNDELQQHIPCPHCGHALTVKEIRTIRSKFARSNVKRVHNPFAALTAEERKERASKAAHALWAKKKGQVSEAQTVSE
jgi:ssDNA-binding Zn-finger/Zn-ribbon topoisomerase 1